MSVLYIDGRDMFDIGSLPYGLQVTLGLFVAWGVVFFISFWRLNSWKLKIVFWGVFAALSLAGIFTGLQWGSYMAQDLINFNARGHHTNPGPWPTIFFEIGWPVLAAGSVVLGILFMRGAWKDHKDGGSGH